MEKQIKELYNMYQENENNNKRRNFALYIMKNEVEELKKETMEIQNDYLSMPKYFDEIIEKKCNEAFNNYFNDKNNNK